MTRIDEETHSTRTGKPTVSGRRAALYCLAILSAATAVTHFAVAGSHFQEYWAFGVFMLAVAWLQLAWAVAATATAARPHRLLLLGGAVLGAGVIAVYIVTRTAGDVIGPTPHNVEPFGFGDGLCTVLEAIIATACAWLLIARADHQVPRQHLVTALTATGTATAVLLSIALVAGGPEMVMNMSGNSASGSTSAVGNMPSTHMSGTGTPAIKLPTATPAGDITMPDTNMQMMPGMKMASSTACTAAPTKAQQQATVSLVDNSWNQARKYQSLAAAKAAGYRPITRTGAQVVHYLNPGYYLNTVMGGPVLNTAEPQSLVYANTPKGAVLVAAMYITSPRNGPTPQPGGCLTQWHVHTNLCLSKGARVVGALNSAHSSCPAGSVNRVTQPMMHVWFVPIPGGPTAIDAPDAQVVHAAEQVASPRNGTA
jgi:hypothetical protein